MKIEKIQLFVYLCVIEHSEHSTYRDPTYASFQGLHDHHVCNGKPPDKAVAFFVAENTTHTNQEKSALLSFNFDAEF